MTKNKKNETKVVAGASYDKKMKYITQAGYVLLTMNCYSRNGLVRDPNFMCRKISPQKHKYLQ